MYLCLLQQKQGKKHEFQCVIQEQVIKYLVMVSIVSFTWPLWKLKDDLKVLALTVIKQRKYDYTYRI